QQIVYFTFKNAVNADVDTKDDAFLTKSGREIYKGYADARNSLREDIDAVARKMEIYLDWPSDRSREPGLKISGDPRTGNSNGGAAACVHDAGDVADRGYSSPLSNQGLFLSPGSDCQMVLLSAAPAARRRWSICSQDNRRAIWRGAPSPRQASSRAARSPSS